MGFWICLLILTGGVSANNSWGEVGLVVRLVKTEEIFLIAIKPIIAK